MDDLVEFLRARLDEVAALADAAGAAEWSLQEHEGDTVLIYSSHGEPVVYDEGWPTQPQARHIVDHCPARVLREVTVKRQLLTEYAEVAHNDGAGSYEYGYGWADGLGLAVRCVAAVYADHPDYRPEWAPNA